MIPRRYEAWSDLCTEQDLANCWERQNKREDLFCAHIFSIACLAMPACVPLRILDSAT